MSRFCKHIVTMTRLYASNLCTCFQAPFNGDAKLDVKYTCVSSLMNYVFHLISPGLCCLYFDFITPSLIAAHNIPSSCQLYFG